MDPIKSWCSYMSLDKCVGAMFPVFKVAYLSVVKDIEFNNLNFNLRGDAILCL
jgi:hypothetical protein